MTYNQYFCLLLAAAAGFHYFYLEILSGLNAENADAGNYIKRLALYFFGIIVVIFLIPFLLSFGADFFGIVAPATIRPYILLYMVTNMVIFFVLAYLKQRR